MVASNLQVRLTTWSDGSRGTTDIVIGAWEKANASGRKVRERGVQVEERLWGEGHAWGTG